MTPRTRPVLRAVVTATVVAGLASACGGAGSAAGSSGVGSPSSAAASSSTSTSSPSGSTDLRATAPDGSAVPDGTWTRTATLADAKALGLTEAQIREHVGTDGELRVEMRVAGADVATFVDTEGEADLVLGDRSRAGYDGSGLWVHRSLSEGCAGCVASFDWSVTGDRLTLRLEEGAGAGDPVDVAVGRLVMEGTYTRR